jgi:hypothetical protein
LVNATDLAHATTTPNTIERPGAHDTPRVDYQLQVRLDHERHTLSGSGVITLHNRSPKDLSELYFQLYLNAFKSPRTLFYRSTTLHARGGARPSQWGALRVTRLRAVSQPEDLWPEVATTPGDPDDETSVLVPLVHPVAAGSDARFEITWEAELPGLAERTGFKDDFHFLGQWFPKLAMLEANGTWSHFPFHPHAEFYANFGDYEVQIDTDSALVVGATGALLREEPAPGLGSPTNHRTLRLYAAPNVHDFAWTSWGGFETSTQLVGGVRVHTLFPKGNERNRERALLAIRHGLAFYGEHFGAYPYPDLTIVHPPRWAIDAGGMEYPQLITTGGAWYLGWLSHAVEQVTLHELGHQWFFGLLASNEAAWPFLDEGLTSFADEAASAALFGDGSGFELGRLRVSELAYYRWCGNRNGAKIAQAASAFSSFGQIAEDVYCRSATLFETLRRTAPEAFEHALARYTREQRFGYPTPNDLLSAFTAEMGAETATLLEQALFERGSVDYALDALECSPTQSRTFFVRASLSHTGTLAFAVDIDFEMANGSTRTEHWDGRDPTHEIRFESDAPVVRARVDPAMRIALDADLSNNARLVNPEPSQAKSGALSTRWALAQWLGLVWRWVAP